MAKASKKSPKEGIDEIEGGGFPPGSNPRDDLGLRQAEDALVRFREGVVSLQEEVRGHKPGFIELIRSLSESGEDPREEESLLADSLVRLISKRTEWMGLQSSAQLLLSSFTGGGEEWGILEVPSEDDTSSAAEAWRELLKVYRTEVKETWKTLYVNIEKAISILNEEIVSARGRLLALRRLEDE